MTEPPARPSPADVAWQALIGMGCGGLVGALIAGPAARVLMLALRLTSPDTVRGVTSDDGFTIGRVGFDTLQLLLGSAFIGAAGGAAYAAGRRILPGRRRRLALWTLLAGAAGGAGTVHTDGVDFTLLEPTWLAIGGFVALFAGGALAIALLVERWAGARAGRDARTAAICAGGLAGGLAVPLTAVAWLAMLGMARIRADGAVARSVRVAAVAAVFAVIALSAVDLGRDISALT